MKASHNSEGRPAQGRQPRWLRVLEVLLGSASLVISVVALVNPGMDIGTLVLLLSAALLLSGVRLFATGGARVSLTRLQSLGYAGGGLLIFGIVGLVLLSPGLGVETVVFLLAIGLSVQGLGRVLHASGRGHPMWIRLSALATGVATIVLVVIAVFTPGLALFSVAALLSLVTLVNGLESVVSGVRPTGRRQLIILKLVLFSLFYGLVLINWIDLFANTAPAYHIWLILTYMAPFGVLIVFQGAKDWQLAFSLGLLVSLTNDVGYYFAGDLLFGFHVQLLPWLAGQLGFLGNQLLFTFQGGLFTIPVTSYLMGASIYARLAVVVGVLWHWWRQPAKVGRLL